MPNYFLMYRDMYALCKYCDKSFYFKKRTYMRKIVAKRAHILQKNESETEKYMFIKYIVDHDRISMSYYTA